MFITNLIQVGEIYQVLCRDWVDEKTCITIKNDGKIVMDKRLVCTREIVDEIYKYLLSNWANLKVQIFCTEKP